RPRRAVQSSECVRTAWNRRDEARIAACYGAPLGVSLLCGPGCGSRRVALCACPGTPGRICADLANTRVLRELEDSREPIAGSFRGRVMTWKPNPLTNGPSRAPTR